MALHLFPFLILFMLGIPAVLVALLIVWAVQRQPVRVPMPPPSARETPLEILDRRFASGEITADEYQKARDLLQARPGTS